MRSKIKSTEVNIYDNASLVSYENEKRKYRKLHGPQLALRQFFKLIIRLEDNETEQNKN